MQPPFRAYSGNDPYIFVCYSHSDADVIFPELLWLKNAGVNLWFDEGINVGASWREEIARAIDAASGFLFYISPRSVVSGHCLREISYAADHDLRFVNVLIEETELPPGVRLALFDRQAIQKHHLPLESYRQKLLNALLDCLSDADQLPAPSPPAHLATPAMHNRVRIGVSHVSKEQLDSGLVAAIARYVSWQGGIYRSHHLATQADPKTRLSLDYEIKISIARNDDSIDCSWEVSRPSTEELVWSSRTKEASMSFLSKVDRIAEMIGEGSLQHISDYEIKQIGDTPLDHLDYGRLMLIANQLNYLDSRQVQKKRLALEQAIKLEPDSAAAHASLSALFAWQMLNFKGLATEDTTHESLVTEAREAIRLDGNDPYVLLTVGTAYCRVGEYDRGLGLIKRAINMAPTVAAKDLLARSFCFAGRPQEAIPLFQEIMESMAAGERFPHVRLAIALCQAGRLEDALAVSNDAVIHYPDDYYGWLVRCNLLSQLGRMEEALSAFQEAKLLVPKLELETVIKNTNRTYGHNEDQRRWLTEGFRRILDAT